VTTSADRPTDGLRNKAKGAVQSLGNPVVGYFDHRFQDLYDRLDDRMSRVYDRVATEVETISELTINMQRFVDVSGQELRDVVGELHTLVARLEDLVAQQQERREPADETPPSPPAEG